MGRAPDPAQETSLPNPWNADADDILAALGSDARHGLTAAEAAARLERYGPNQLQATAPVPRWRRILEQFRNPLTYLLLVAVLVSLAAWLVEGAEGVPFDALVITLIVVANTLLGCVQEVRAERAVAALQSMASASTCVVRDGSLQPVPATEVVPGDIIQLSEGDAVSVDGRLIEASSLKVAEASLTGESEPILKNTATISDPVSLGDRLNMVFNGTAVASGRGRAVVTATGMATEMGAIATLLGRTEEEPTPLQREVNLIGRTLGIAVIVIAVIVVGAILLTSDIESASDLVDVLLIGVSLAVAAVPEGLPAVLSVVLALGVQRMADQRAIVKKLSSVETLGSATVICSDKTGTLTRNEMTMRIVVTGSATVELTGTGYEPAGDALIDGRPLSETAHDRQAFDELRMVLWGGSLANDATLRQDGDAWTVQGDPTDAAFLVAEAKLGLTQDRTERFHRVAEAPFTSERKLMSSLEADEEQGDELVLFVKGAPDVLLDRCRAELVAGEERALTDERRSAIRAVVDDLAGEALRPLAVAFRRLPGTAAPDDAAALESMEEDLVYLGMVGIIDPPRPEAAAAIRAAHDAGIRIIMITGDHPRTALRIASELGLASPETRAVTGLELESMDPDELRQVVRDVSVYARVAPRSKLDIVDALQADGNVVAMTGDGVNDAPALRAADIGVAMGITGTDVSKEAGDMILTDDNFATIVDAVREGRGIFANIRTFLRFLLSSNAGEVFTMFFGVMAAGLLDLDDTGEAAAVPLLATQILWINLLTDTAPALALGVDPPQDDLMERPPRRMTDRVIDTKMQAGIVFVGIVMAIVTLAALDLRLPGGLLGGSSDIEEARTMAFTTLVLAQLFNCFNARSDRTSAFHRMFTNRYLWLAIGASLALQAAVVHLPFLNAAFSTSPLSPVDWAVCALLASVVLWADELRKLVARAMAT